MSATNIEAANPWSGYMVDIYRSRRPPQPLGTLIFDEIEEQAKEKLRAHGGAFMYAGGSAGANLTYDANINAFKKWGIVPRMLVNATQRSLSTTVFGIQHTSPIFIAPIGVQSIFAEEAEFNPARAAQALGIPFILSTASSRTMEEVAAANGDGHRWFQLYWPKSEEVTLSLLSRAKNNGYTALVVTLDTMSIGWRPADLATSYLPFVHSVGCQMGLSDPVFMARIGKTPITGKEGWPKFPYVPKALDLAFANGDPVAKEKVSLGLEWLKEANSGLFRSWSDLKFLRDNWEGPLVLKGIQSVQDAESALEYGANGIIVSNHGGRQVDGAIPSLLALEHICSSPKIQAAQKEGQLTVLFDSGIRTGADIFKAVAIGAQGVLIGRPWLYGSVIAGQAGIEQVIKTMLGDLDATLSLAGFRSLEEIWGKRDEVLMRL